MEVFCLSIPHPEGHIWKKGEISGNGWDQVIVRLTTDEGLTGIGESYHLKNPMTVAAAIKGLEKMILGQDPFNTEYIWETLFGRVRQMGPTGIAAISGVDIACWDIVGKATNLPVYKLLGGKTMEKARLYVGGHALGWRDLNNLDDLIREAEKYVKAGFKALKLRGGRALPDRGDVESVKALREHFGDDLQILVDVNDEYKDYKTAMKMARVLNEYNLFWLEDPFTFSTYLQPQDMIKLSRNAPMPIATGGGTYSRFVMQNIMENGGVDVVMANTAKGGGISEIKKMVAVVSAWNKKYSPHCDGGFNTLSNLHVFASSPIHITEDMYMEWDPVWPLAEVLTDPPVVKDGCAYLPEKPGIGSDLREDALEKFAYRDDTWYMRG